MQVFSAAFAAQEILIYALVTSDTTIPNPVNIRNEDLQRLIDSARTAIFAACPRGSCLAAAEAIFERLTQVYPQAKPISDPDLPAKRYLGDCFKLAEHGPGVVGDVAKAMSLLEPLTPWARRRDPTRAQADFHEGHANAIYIGPGGFEKRTDVLVGASLMGPRLQYPDHSHPPEEIYLAMGAGGWRRNNEDWSFPLAGQLFYNTPNVIHAMVTQERPLLALWCLLPKDGVLR